MHLLLFAMLDNFCKHTKLMKAVFQGRMIMLLSRAQEGFSPAVQNFRRRGNLHGLIQISRQFNNKTERQGGKDSMNADTGHEQNKKTPGMSRSSSILVRNLPISINHQDHQATKTSPPSVTAFKHPLTIFVPYGSAFDLFL